MTLQPGLAIVSLATCSVVTGWIAAHVVWYRRLRLPFDGRAALFFVAAILFAAVGISSSVWTLVTRWRG